ncbi:Pex12 amino terminal region-domain-containing protein [Cantharellus anzutake]|uniref:Pex12 amino terminal region-domain-containing protein n=1 Tax=Cantharellus anzutake TaxID=1750568 RepID=UPI001907DC2B|nr:Pex12 amino terminal region-domain-containing protein [Cantharellus anzutake]KAF8342036.1 Pex12 amino terminal region-domain-containing protein [Cantharellus anzutake]
MDFFSDIGGGSLYKPSLFELVAQEQLRDMLQPALKYVLSVFAQRYPRYLLRVVNCHEEFHALIMFFVERHYLREYGASFSEHFYGLKRRRKPIVETERANTAVGGIPAQEKLRRIDVLSSLFFLVGIPYLRAKAQDYYEQLGGGVDPELMEEPPAARRLRVSEQTLGNRLRRLFKAVYPWANGAYELWLLGYNVAYLFDKTTFYRPWLSWIGVDMKRMGADDYQLMEGKATQALQGQSSSQKKRGLLAFIGRLLISSPQLLLDSLKVLLPMSIFFVKFLEWWYSPSSPARSLAAAPTGPPIPPPRMLPPHPRGIPIDGTKYGECPLCRKMLENATALPSGYVFCYKCAHEHVETHGRCPVTLLPARIWQLRKVLI